MTMKYFKKTTQIKKQLKKLRKKKLKEYQKRWKNILGDQR